MSIYIDTETGTWGDASKLAICGRESGLSDDLTGQPDSEVIRYGNTYGYSLEDTITDAIETWMSDIVEFDGEVLASVKQLYYAAEAILEALGVDPSEPCKLCDTTFGFHTSECPTHEMNIATDAVAEWVR